MTYFFAEDTKKSEKLIQLISQSMDIMDQSASQSVFDMQTNFSQRVSLSVYPWQTD